VVVLLVKKTTRKKLVTLIFLGGALQFKFMKKFPSQQQALRCSAVLSQQDFIQLLTSFTGFFAFHTRS
jgi:hypothetical protein